MGYDGRIDEGTIAVGSKDSYVNATSKTLELSTGHLFNNTANLFVYNNATYQWVKMKLAVGQNEGKYPSNLKVDLNNDGRLEYAFTGSGSGEMGSQSWMYSPTMTVGQTLNVYPSTSGDYVKVKVPTGATVKSVSFNLTHPVEAVYNTVTLTATTPGLNYDIGYWYAYDYSQNGGSYTYNYGYPYYYMNMAQYYAMASPSSYYYIPMGYSNYIGYSYKPSSSYDYYRYENPYNYYIKWDHTNPALVVPAGANLLEYKLVWPVREYCYYASYGYSWTTNSNRYYAGERTYGAYEVTAAWPTTYQYKYDGGSPGYWYAYNYSPSQIQPWTNSSRLQMINDYFPKTSTTPVATHKIPEVFYTTTYYDYTSMSFDIYSTVRKWLDGTMANNGFMVNIYQTPYSTYPHWPGSYCLYNKPYVSSSPWDRNNGLFYMPGMFGNPYYTYNTAYEFLKPKLVVGFSLPSEGLWFDVGDDGSKEFQYTANSGYLEGTVGVNGYQNQMNAYLRTHFADYVDDYGNEWTYVPIKMGASQSGKVVVKDLKVTYDYEPEIFYNPNSGTGTLAGELNRAVPKLQSGYTLVPINVTSSTPGKVTIKDVEIVGMKSNFAPYLVSRIPDTEVPEGVSDDTVIPLSDYIQDVEQDSTSLIYLVQKNDKPARVSVSIKESDGKVYLAVDAIDKDWYGNVTVQVSATDSGGKALWTNEFKLNVLSVNDEPYLINDLPSIVIEEGVDDLQIDYQAPIGRGTAKGKWSMMMKGDGGDHFADVEGQEILLDFQLLDEDLVPQPLELSDEGGFRVYKGALNEVTLTVLPPEYTDDPDNYVVLIGSDGDYSSEGGDRYYLGVYASDDPGEPLGQTELLIPIEITPVNDEPVIGFLPEIVMNEDETFVSADFVSTYITDVDTPANGLSVTVASEETRIAFEIVEGDLNIIPEENYNGISYASVRVFDGIGETTAEFRVVVKSANDIPTLVVNNVYEGMLVDDILVIRGTAEDAEKDLKSVQVAIIPEGGMISSDDWTEVSGTYIWNQMLDIRDYENGEYEIHVRAYDGSRDFSEEFSATVTIISPKQEVSLTPPVISIDTDLSGIWEDTIDISGSVEDDSGYLEFVEYRVDSGNWKRATQKDMGSWSCVLNTRMMENGGHMFMVRAYDGKAYSEESRSSFDVMNEDSDLDGVTNDVERVFSMDPFNPIDGAMDFDEDGFSNAMEIAAGTDIFSAEDHPDDPNADDSRIDAWAIIMVVVAFLFAVVILGLFMMNLRIDRRIHKFREELGEKRAIRKEKTLLQRIVEIAPNYRPNVVPLSNQTLSEGPAQENLPPAPENN